MEPSALFGNQRNTCVEHGDGKEENEEEYRPKERKVVVIILI